MCEFTLAVNVGREDLSKDCFPARTRLLATGEPGGAFFDEMGDAFAEVIAGEAT